MKKKEEKYGKREKRASYQENNGILAAFFE
jgi:hypothetical protein